MWAENTGADSLRAACQATGARRRRCGLTGGSFGLQLGADSTDIILLVMNEKGLERLLADKVALGADVAVAAGPVGRDAKANTDVLMHAEVLGWSRTRGIFAGVSLNGTSSKTTRRKR